MFPASKIADHYSCARTKTKAIITHALVPAVKADILCACAGSPFSILYDGGNDKKYIIKNHSPMGKTVTRLPACNIATGQTLFDELSTALFE